MCALEASGLNSSVLVLNRQYMAVHVVGVRRAFGLLLNELAEVIHIEDGQYGNYDFDSWREISELKAEFKQPEEDWVRSVNLLRAPAETTRAIEPSQHLCPRRQPVSVLRKEVSHQRT